MSEKVFLEILDDFRVPEDLRKQLWGLLTHIAAVSNIDKQTYRQLLFKTKYVLSLIKMSVPDYSHDLNFYTLLEQIETYVILQLRRSIGGFERTMQVTQKIYHYTPQQREEREGLVGKVGKFFGW